MVETSGCFVWCPSIAIRGRAGQRGREKGADCDVTEAKEDRKTRKEEAELKALKKMCQAVSSALREGVGKRSRKGRCRQKEQDGVEESRGLDLKVCV